MMQYTHLQSSFLGEEVSLKRMNSNRPISTGCSLHITEASSQPDVDKIFELIQLVREKKFSAPQTTYMKVS